MKKVANAILYFFDQIIKQKEKELKKLNAAKASAEKAIAKELKKALKK